MKKVIFSSLLIAGTALAACSGNNNGHAESKHIPAAEAETTAPTTPPVIKNEALQAAYAHYEALQQALVAGKQQEAAVAAQKLAEALKTAAQSASLISNAEAIAKATDINEQRKTFSALSNEMITALKAAGMQSGELYVQFCPMALDNTGAYWISSKKQILNPYFGDAMLHCGETKETVK